MAPLAAGSARPEGPVENPARDRAGHAVVWQPVRRCAVPRPANDRLDFVLQKKGCRLLRTLCNNRSSWTKSFHQRWPVALRSISMSKLIRTYYLNCIGRARSFAKRAAVLAPLRRRAVGLKNFETSLALCPLLDGGM